ncbi:hypothetical protein [Streptomyces sp. NPDC001889]
MGGSSLASWIITIVGTLFGAVLAVRSLGHWARSEWGALVTHLIGAAIAAFAIFNTDKAIDVLSAIGDKIASVFTG